MKNIIQGLVIAVAVLAGCNGNKPARNQSINERPEAMSQADITSENVPVSYSKSTVSIKEIVNPYLQLKNALANDNASDAATEGKVLETSLRNFDKTTLTPEQKKTYEDLEADAVEHAEHIGQNGGDIKHQREHFELLSNDIYDLAKAFNAGQVLYKDFCPMYNEGKGAFWLSESKEIHNPYYGKEMPTCGTIKEVLN